MKTEVALLLLLACLCSGRRCPPKPSPCNNNTEMRCWSEIPGYVNGCPKRGKCIPRYVVKLPLTDGYKCDTTTTCRNFCKPQKQPNKTNCPPVHRYNGCQKPFTRRERLDQCPESEFDKNGCRLCKDDEMRCGPCCNKKDSFCIKKKNHDKNGCLLCKDDEMRCGPCCSKKGEFLHSKKKS